MKIPLSAAEKRLLESAAIAAQAKPVTWCREILVRAARRRKD